MHHSRGGAPQLRLQPQCRFLVGDASFFGVLQVIKVLDEAHLARRAIIGVSSVRIACPLDGAASGSQTYGIDMLSP